MKKNVIILLCFSIILSCKSEDQQVENETVVVNIEKGNEVEIEPVLELENENLDSMAIAVSNLIAQFPEFDDYKVNTASDNFQIIGDFYGDHTDDIAVLVKKANETKIGIIDYGHDTIITFIGNKIDGLGSTNYSWIGVFETVESGDTLWSNFEEDWRDFDEVPLSEKVVLNYDAIYAHALESCGGGFIFWKDNKWNWLQQE